MLSRVSAIKEENLKSGFWTPHTTTHCSAVDLSKSKGIQSRISCPVGSLSFKLSIRMSFMRKPVFFQFLTIQQITGNGVSRNVWRLYNCYNCCILARTAQVSKYGAQKYLNLDVHFQGQNPAHAALPLTEFEKKV